MSDVAVAAPRPTHVELPAAASAALVAAGVSAGFARFGVTWEGLLVAATLGVLAVLTVVDLRERRLPNRIVLPSAAVAVVAHSLILPEYAVEWVVCALMAALALFIPALINPKGIGLGDVKLMLLLGAVLGTDVLDGLVLGLVSIVPYCAYLFIRHGSAARGMTFPLGPFLAFGAALVLMLAGPREPQIVSVPESVAGVAAVTPVP
jgi:leader peptidase (prepilin peptidase)/N-methyltransferase